MTNLKLDQDSLHFIPLGGCGQFGCNLNVYAYEGQYLAVDIGMGFADERQPGVDIMLPDPTFLEEHKDKLVGLVLTHAHEDHIGSLGHLWPRLECPIYASPLTAAMVKRKLKEYGLDKKVEVHVFEYNNPFSVGPFEIEPIRAAHSIPDCGMLTIKTGETKVLHTGDWKTGGDAVVGHDTDVERLKKLGEEGAISAMLGDSTNVIKHGQVPSEENFYQAFEAVLEQNKEGAIFMACQGLSALSRLRVLYQLLPKYGRRLAVMGFSMRRGVEVAAEQGVLPKEPLLLDIDDVMTLQPEQRFVVCTGSQAEPRAALTRLAEGTHHRAKVNPGDTVVFSARIIPGNETGISEMKNLLRKKGINIITNDEIPHVYISGHAHGGEAASLINWVKPKSLIPVHGDFDHQEVHIEIAEECGVNSHILPENGDVIKIEPDGKLTKIFEVETGLLAVDGERLIDAEQSEALRERRKLGYNGAVSLSVQTDRNGELLHDPEIIMFGLSESENDHDAYIESLSQRIENDIDRMDDHTRSSYKDLHEVIRLAIRRKIRKDYGKKPLIAIHLTMVE